MQSSARPSPSLLQKNQAGPVGRVGMERVTQSCAGSCQSCRLGLLAYKGMGAERMRVSGKGMSKGENIFIWEHKYSNYGWFFLTAWHWDILGGSEGCGVLEDHPNSPLIPFLEINKQNSNFFHSWRLHALWKGLWESGFGAVYFSISFYIPSWERPFSLPEQVNRSVFPQIWFFTMLGSKALFSVAKGVLLLCWLPRWGARHVL